MSRRRSISKGILIALILVFCIVPQTHVLGREAFTLRNYHIELKVGRDNAYEVTETFDAVFSEKRHGLVRSIPTATYNGGTVAISQVTCNQPFRTYEHGGLFDIKIGDADTYVEGTVPYRITYRFDIGDDGLPNMDELYFNLVGTDWDTTISDVSFRIVMPKPFSAERLKFTSGPRGSRDEAPADFRVKDQVIEGKLLRGLGPHEGLTIALPLPKGYFDGPLRSGFNYQQKTEPYIYGFWLLLAVFIVFVINRSNRRPTALSLHPPADMNPADMLYIRTRSLRGKGISALLLDWARRGLIRLEPDGPDGRLRLTPLDHDDPSMKDYERNLLNAFRESSEVLYVDRLPALYGSRFRRLRQGIKNYWSKERRIFSRWTYLWRFIGVLWAIAPYFLFLYNRVLTKSPNRPLVIGSLWLIAAVVYLFPWAIASDLIRSFTERPLRNIPGLLLAAFIYYIIPCTLFIAAEKAINAPASFVPFTYCFLSSFVSSILFSLAVTYTRYGRQRLAEIRGYEIYLRTAQIGRGEDGTFFDNLPFVYSIGNLKNWASKFAELEAPLWYQMDYSSARSIQRPFRRVDRVSTSPVSSSGGSSSSSSGGSSSGGSSGGGSGGGGGGSW